MKKYLFFAIFLLMTVSRGWADVDVNVTATKFIATVSEIDFYNSTTGQWITAGTGIATFDIASVGSGQTVGNYISGANLPNGTYTQIRLIAARSMQIEASDVANGFYTNGGSEPDPNLGNPGARVALLTANPAQLGLSTLHTTNNSGSSPQAGEYSQDINGTDNFEATFSSPAFAPFTLTGSSKTIKMSFFITNITTFDETTLTASNTTAPTISITVQ